MVATFRGSLLTRTKLVVVGVLAALTLALGVGAAAAPGTALANAGNCRGGLNTATTAWGYCSYVGGPTYTSAFKLTVNCYYYPQQSTYGTAGHTVYASCPGWSHVTGIFVNPWYG
jgi:hypothetical protein